MADPHLPPSADPDRTADRPGAAADPITVDATADSTDPRSAGAPPGPPVVPGYRVTAEIARGGMGRVYAAVDLTLDREVAIKTLLPGADPSRFVTESKITAKLPHPCIPPVHTLGALSDGTPFLAMKLIRGTTLAEQLKARPAPSHDLPRFVQVFEQVAQAVGFAHSRGVIHRDLKPLNVMVGEFGEVQVMDWGLAREAGVGRQPPGREGADAPSSGADADLTRAGAVMGTPGYMAPEQARGEPVDARADVFALGSTLAALLTGRPAFVGATAAETVQKAGKADLADVFARLDSCGADAELVGLAKRCLGADRDGRPADGRAVAGEVAAYRAGVEARLKQAETDRAEAVVREGEQRKRRRQFNIAAGVVVGVLLAGVIGTALGLVEAWKQAGIARQQEGFAKAETAEKEKALADETEANANLWAGLGVMTSALTGHSLASQKAVSAEQKKFLESVLPLYQKLAAKAGNDEVTRARVANAADRVALIESRLGRKEEAVQAVRQALDGYEKLVADFPSVVSYRRDLATSRNSLGLLLRDLGEWSEAEVQYQKALDLHGQLAADFPAEPEHRRNLAGSHNNLGLLLKDLGRRGPADQRYTDALSIFEKLVADFPAAAAYRSDLAGCYMNRAVLLAGMGSRAEAEGQYRKGVGLVEQLVSDFPTDPTYRQELGTSLNNLGLLLRDLGKRPEAEEVFKNAITLQGKLTADFPAAPDYRQELARSHSNLGLLLAGFGRGAEAEGQHRKGMAIREKLVADFPAVPDYRVNLGGSYCNFGNLLRNGGKPADSLDWFGKAIDTLRPVLEQEPRDVAARQWLRTGHRSRASAYDRLRRYAEAVTDWDRAVELSPKEEQPRLRASRVMSKLNAGQVAAAVAEVTELRELAGVPSDILYNFACVYAVASGELADRKAEYADSAMEVLRQAVKAGWKDAAHMKRDADLDPLRARDDFRKLVAELEARFPPKREALPPPRRE